MKNDREVSYQTVCSASPNFEKETEKANQQLRIMLLNRLEIMFKTVEKTAKTPKTLLPSTNKTYLVPNRRGMLKS